MNTFFENKDFYNNFSSKPDLDEEVENYLIKKAQNGCIKSQQIIIMHNIKRAFKSIMPCKYTQRFDEEDLFQESVIAMIKAIKTFKPEKGIKFGNYAKYKIKKYIIKYIDNNIFCIKVPTYLKELFKRIKTIENKYLQNNNLEYPTIKYLSQELNTSEEVISRCLELFDSNKESPSSNWENCYEI